MAASTLLLVAQLIAMVGFVPHPSALGACLNTPPAREFSSLSDPFQGHPKVKRLLARLEDKSLAAKQQVELAREVVQEVEATTNKRLKFHAYLTLLEYVSIQTDLNECKNILQLAAEIDEKVDAPKLTARLQYFKARYLNKIGKYKESIELIKKARASQLLSPQDHIASNLVLGASCGRLGLFEQAFAANQAVLINAKSGGLSEQDAEFKLAKSNVAWMLVRMKEFKKAKVLYDELDPLDSKALIFLRVTLGRCEIALSENDIDTAMELSQNALDIWETQEIEFGKWRSQMKRGLIGLVYLIRARCYFNRKNLPTAQRVCEKAVELIKNRPRRLYDSQAILGVIVASRGNPERGIKIVREAYEAADAAGLVYSKLIASEKLTKLYEDNGRFEEAFSQFKLTEEIENSMKIDDLKLRLELNELQHRARLDEQRINTEGRAETRRAELVAANAISQAEKSKAIQYGIGLAFSLSLLGGTGYFVSQSRRKKTQNQLNEARERAERQEELAQKKRIEDIGELTESVAHDFNNILQVICQTNFLIEDSLGEQLTSMQKKLLQNEGNAVAVASEITEQLLTYAKRQATAPKVVLVSTMLDLAHELFGPVSDSTQVKMLKFDETLAINVDPRQFSSSILNLLLNARDSMGGGGLIEVRVFKHTIFQRSSLQLQAGDYVCIEVSDSGKGMDDEQLQRACEPFFTTKPPTIGTGLGLSSVKGFVEQAAGAIKIESTFGCDATVSLYFPKADAARDSNQLVKGDSATEITNNRVCLIVEDNPLVRATLDLMMESCGYQSTSCCSADEAHDLLKTENDFSLVLSDIRMPGEWDGIDLARWMKVTIPEIQIVLISGNDAPSDLEHFPFLRKPFRFADLQAILKIQSVHQ